MILAGQHRVDVGVRRAGEGAAPVGEQQVVAVVPVLHGLEQDERGDQQRELQGGLRGDLASRAGQPDAAEQVLHDRDGDEADGQDDEHPAEDQLDHRQGEDVETDVVVELRIVGAEVAAVQPELDDLPVALGGQPGDQRDDTGNAEREQLGTGGDDRPVRRERIDLVGRARTPAGTGRRPPGRPSNSPPVASAGDQEHPDPADRLGGEDLAESDLAEPQPVDVDPHELEPQDRQHGQADQGDQYPLRALGHGWQTNGGPDGHGWTPCVETSGAPAGAMRSGSPRRVEERGRRCVAPLSQL